MDTPPPRSFKINTCEKALAAGKCTKKYKFCHKTCGKCTVLAEEGAGAPSSLVQAAAAQGSTMEALMMQQMALLMQQNVKLTHAVETLSEDRKPSLMSVNARRFSKDGSSLITAEFGASRVHAGVAGIFDSIRANSGVVRREPTDPAPSSWRGSGESPWKSAAKREENEKEDAEKREARVQIRAWKNQLETMSAKLPNDTELRDMRDQVRKMDRDVNKPRKKMGLGFSSPEKAAMDKMNKRKRKMGFFKKKEATVESEMRKKIEIKMGAAAAGGQAEYGKKRKRKMLKGYTCIRDVRALACARGKGCALPYNHHHHHM